MGGGTTEGVTCTFRRAVQPMGAMLRRESLAASLATASPLAAVAPDTRVPGTHGSVPPQCRQAGVCHRFELLSIAAMRAGLFLRLVMAAA